MDASRQDTPLAWAYGCVGATTLLLYAAFHPINLGLLAWIALVPLLLLSASRGRLRAVFGVGAATGLLFHLIGLSWLALCTPPGWLATVALEALYMGLSLLLTELIRRRCHLPYGFVLPVIWTALDFERARFKFFAFPWLLIGQSQHGWDTLLQVSDITGVYGVGFVVLMANGLIADTLLHRTALVARLRASDAPALAPLGGFGVVLKGWGTLAALLVVMLIYGGVRRSQVEGAQVPGPGLLLIQTDIPSRNDAPPPPSEEVTGRLLNLAERAYPEHLDEYDVIVVPETMWYYPFSADGEAWIALLEERGQKEARLWAQLAQTRRRRLENLARVAHAPILVGAIDHQRMGEELRPQPVHNSVFWMDARGEVTGRYDKVRPAPVSEYVPGKGSALWGWFHELIRSMVPEGFVSFEPGAGPVLFEVDGVQLAPNVCFDVSFADTMARATAAGADVHVNVSNYSWFRDSQALEFAFVQAKLRAIETRRAVVKCVNGGPSGAYDATGAEAGMLGHLSEAELRAAERASNEGSIVVRPRTTEMTTLYVWWGDAFAFGVVLWALGLLGLAWRGRVGVGEPASGLASMS